MSNQYKYRVIKFIHSIEDSDPIYIIALQVYNGHSWYALNASDKIADIKHACQEGRNQEEKIKAYTEFITRGDK